MLKKTHVIIYLFSFIFLQAHQLVAQPKHMFFQHYATDDGLSQGSIYAIYQDSKNFIWFGTWDGLNRFDGYSFKVFKPNLNQPNTIKGSRVAAIIEDKAGNIWTGTYEALNKYVPGKNVFEQFYCMDENGNKLKSRYYPFYIDDKNELWFTYQVNKLASINLSSNIITTYPFANGAMQIFASPEGNRFAFYKPLNLIYTTGNDGMRIINLQTKKISYYFSANTENRIGKKQLIWISLIDNKGMVWLAGQNGLMSFNPGKNTFQLYKDFRNGLTATAFTALVQDNKGLLWCGSDGNGLWVFDAKSQSFTGHYTKEIGNINSLSENVITSIFYDKENNLWVNADPQGIDKTNLDYQQFKRLQFDTVPNGSPNSVWSICNLDSNHVLVCFNQTGMIKYEFSTGKRIIYHLPKNFKETSVYHAIKDNAGNIWMASDVGLYHSKDKLQSIQRINDIKYYYYVYLYDDNGRILCGTDKGLFSIPSNLSQTSFDTIPEFLQMNISTIAKGPNHEVCVANAKNELFFIHAHGKNYIIKEKMQFDFLIKSIWCQHDSILWLGTNVGLVKYHLSSKTFKLYNEDNGLANNYVYGLLPDKHNHLWLSSNKGISDFDMQTGKFSNHGLSEGIQAWEFNSRSYSMAQNGTMFFGGINGMNYFHPDSLQSFDFIPPVRLLSVTINSANCPLENFDLARQPLEVDHDNNNFTFEFAALDYNRIKQITFYYKLYDKKEEEWKIVNSRGVLHLVDLSPGKYHLQIMAQEGNNRISPKQLHCYFSIRNPYYKTWWFIIFSLLAIAGIVYAIYRARIQQIMQVAAIKTSISQDLHDDIGSTLSSISMYTDIAKSRERKSESVSDLLEKINFVSKDLVRKMSDIVWSLNDNNGSIGQLKQRMDDYAAMVLNSMDISYSFNIPTALMDIKLNARQLKAFFFIFKEALNNSMKYANCQQVAITASIIDGRMKLLIQDDGQGFDTSAVKQSMGGAGLKNMKARAESLNGSCEVMSSIGHGTRLCIEAPLDRYYHLW